MDIGIFRLYHKMVTSVVVNAPLTSVYLEIKRINLYKKSISIKVAISAC